MPKGGVPRLKRIKINVTAGAIIVEGAVEWRRSNDICALYVSTKSKRARVLCSGSDSKIPMIALEVGEHSLHLDPAKPRGAPTSIAFPGFAGWSVFAVSEGKYSTAVCLTKDKT